MYSMKDLTGKQQSILEYIESYIAGQGYPPTIREIGEQFSITAKGAYDHLKAIEKKGYIKCEKNRSRAIELLKTSSGSAPLETAGVVNIPLLGRVAAGMPILAEENIEEYLAFPRVMVPENGVFALRVAGDSMKDAGIYDGVIAGDPEAGSRPGRRNRRRAHRRRSHAEVLSFAKRSAFACSRRTKPTSRSMPPNPQSSASSSAFTVRFSPVG